MRSAWVLGGLFVSSCCLGGSGASTEWLAPPLPPWAPGVPTISTARGAPATTARLELDADTILVRTGVPNDDRSLPAGIYLVSATSGDVRNFVPADATLVDRLTGGAPAVRRDDGVVWNGMYDPSPGLYLLGADGSYTLLHATNGIYSFFFSHDGRRVAYGTFRTDVEPAGACLTVAALPSGAPVPTSQAAEESMAFVGDDHVIVNARTDLAITTVRGTDTRVIAAGWRGYDYAASPDGTRVIFVGGALLAGHGLYMIDGDGQNLRPLPWSGGDLTWSPDGSHVAMLFGDGHLSTGVRVIDRDGAAVAELSLPANADPNEVTRQRHEGITRIAWSPDGTRLALLVDLGGACSTPLNGGCDCDAFLYLVDRDGTGLTRVSDRMLGCGASILW